MGVAMFQQRTWILQRANIELLRECQRNIYELFSEKLSLTQKDLIERILYFSNRSDNQQFLDAVSRLKESLERAAFDFSALPLDSDAAKTRVYRGQVIPSDETASSYDKPVKFLKSTTDALQGEPVSSASTTKRVYRGRVVS